MGTNIGTQVTEAELSVSTRSQYASAALNEKFRALPQGVVRGFIPRAAAGVPNTLVLQVDPLMHESVMNVTPEHGPYAVTYRTEAALTFDFTGFASGRWYIAFRPDYVILQPTTGQWIAYTEAQFEAGDLESEGAHLTCAINLDADGGTDIDPWDVMVAGESAGGKLFLREGSDNYQTAHGPRESTPVVDFQPNPFGSNIEQISGTLPSYTDTERKGSSGALAFTMPGEVYLGDHMTVWQEATNASDHLNGTVVVQFWVKTGASPVGAFEVFPRFFDALGAVADPGTIPAQVPTFKSISGEQLDWRLVRMEMKIPHTSPIRATTVRLVARSTVSASTFFLGRAQAWVVNEPMADAGAWGQGATRAALSSIALTGRTRFPGPAPTDRGWSLQRLGADEIRLESDASANKATFRVLTAGAGPTELRLVGDGTLDSSILGEGAWVESDLGLRADVLRIRSASIFEVWGSSGGLNNARVSCETLISKVIRSQGLTGIGTSEVLFRDDANSDSCDVQAYSFTPTDAFLGKLRTDRIESFGVGGTINIVDPAGDPTAILESGTVIGSNHLASNELWAGAGSQVDVLTSTGLGGATLAATNLTADSTVTSDEVVANNWVQLSQLRTLASPGVVSLQDSAGNVENCRLQLINLTLLSSSGGFNGRWGSGQTTTSIELDAFYRAAMPVAQGGFTSIGSGSGFPSWSFRAGTEVFNVKNPQLNAVGGTMTVEFIRAMDNANYTVVLGRGDGTTPALFAGVANQTTTSFDVVFRDRTTLLPVNLDNSGVNTDMHFAVFGRYGSP